MVRRPPCWRSRPSSCRPRSAAPARLALRGRSPHPTYPSRDGDAHRGRRNRSARTRDPEGMTINGFQHLYRTRPRFRSVRAGLGHPGRASALPAGASAEGAARRSRRDGVEPDQRRRRQRQGRHAGQRAAAGEAAQGRGRWCRAALSVARGGQALRECGEGREEGWRQLRHRRAPAAGAGHVGIRRRQGAEGRRRHGAGLERGHRDDPQGPDGRERVRRGQLRGAQEVHPRSHTGRPGRQARSRHRPRRGDPPGHPGVVAPDQEQPGADR